MKNKKNKLAGILFLITLLLSLNLIFFSFYARDLSSGQLRGVELSEILYIIPLLFSYLAGIFVYFIIKHEE